MIHTYIKATQNGQTLIETLVAVFVLVMGIVAALGLAIYALNASSNVTKQIVAIGLAREGIEAVKNMRDTNWLKEDLDVNGCYDYTTGQPDQADCYEEWLSPTGGADATPDEDQKPNTSGYDLDYSSPRYLFLTLDPDVNNRYWRMNDTTCNAVTTSGANCAWGLDFDGDVSGAGFKGFYTVSNFDGNGRKHGTSDYYRKITVVQNETSPFRDELEKLEVTVQVWWVDRKCPRARDWSEAKQSCRIQLESYLTNWKDY